MAVTAKRSVKSWDPNRNLLKKDARRMVASVDGIAMLRVSRRVVRATAPAAFGWREPMFLDMKRVAVAGRASRVSVLKNASAAAIRPT